MNKYVIWFHVDSIVGYTHFISLEAVLEDAYLHNLGFIPNETIYETEILIASPFQEP